VRNVVYHHKAPLKEKEAKAVADIILMQMR
jgi:hypothetical protein